MMRSWAMRASAISPRSRSASAGFSAVRGSRSRIRRAKRSGSSAARRASGAWTALRASPRRNSLRRSLIEPVDRFADGFLELCPQRREPLPDRLGQHEAHVLLDDLELLDVADAAGAEEVDEALDELLGRAGPRGDADDALALEPRLLDLPRVVDQMRVGAVVAGDLDQPLRVRR